MANPLVSVNLELFLSYSDELFRLLHVPAILLEITVRNTIDPVGSSVIYILL
jgi:hypothetical protein